MKRLVFILAAGLSMSASAGWNMIHDPGANKIMYFSNDPDGASVGTRFTLTQYADETTAAEAAASLVAAGATVADGVILSTNYGYPQPEQLFPLMDDNLNQIGTARGFILASTMEFVGTTNTASPRRSWAVQKAALASNKAERAAIVAALKAQKTSMTNTIAQSQALDPTAYPAGAERTQEQIERRALIDTAQDLNLMRRTLLRYFKETE